MTVTIKNKEYELYYTFNSFKHMDEFDLSVLESLETKPFMLINMAETLLHGALNTDRKNRVPIGVTSELLETYVEDGQSLSELVQLLMAELEESSFFKSLQK